MSAGRRALLLAAALAASLASGCGGRWAESRAWQPFRPDREGYLAFRQRHPEVLDPNYLPFMLHRVPSRVPGEDLLVFCRWPSERFPLPVYVEAPRIAAELQDEFAPKPPSAYVAAMYGALGIWESALEGLVQFRPVQRPGDAVLVLRLVGEEAPAPDAHVTVLGTTRLGGACRVQLGGDESEQLPARFEVTEVRIFVADASGLLNPDQVERIALHEIGHALGMRGHSPLPADLMFEVARDRPIRESTLSIQDMNSFLSLYRVANGTVYARLATGSDAAGGDGASAPSASAGPSGVPRLDPAPHVDARYGYELTPPEGWMRVETLHGMIAVDGVSWDYDASFQVIARRYPTIESYLERYGPAHLGSGRLVERRELEVAGRRALRAVVAARVPGMLEELTFVERGDGRILIVIADCPAERYAAYAPWFEAALASLELWEEGRAPLP